MKRKRVALIYGGAGAEHEVSLFGAEYVLGLIDRKRYIPYPILIDKSGEWLAEGDTSRPITLKFTARGGILTEGDKPVPIAAAFPLLHGDMGEDGCVQGILECAKIPYVGCGVAAGAVSCDKALTKDVARTLGIPVADDILISEPLSADTARRIAEAKIGYPMFIKPSGLGSSVGAHRVTCREDFAPAYQDASAKGGSRVLIEEYIEDKREIECAYLASSHGEIFTHPGEIITHGVYDYEEKYSENSHTRTEVHARVTESVAVRVKEYSRLLVCRIGVRQISRIDFFLCGGRLIFNEINTMPGFTQSSLYPALIREAGISPERLVSELIEGASLR